MPTSPDDLAADAARDFSRALCSRWRDRIGSDLLGIYLLGSLAHAGFSRRYSDIDLGVVTETGLTPAMLDGLRADAVAVSADHAGKLSIFWTDRQFTLGRFPPLDRLDYLDRPTPLFERERVAAPRPSLATIRRYLTGAPMTNWQKTVDAFAAATELLPRDRKSYLRAHLYPARFVLSFMTGAMDSNDAAVAYLQRFAPAGLDVDLVRRALDIRLAAADPDPLFPERALLRRQFAACAAFVAESEAEQP